MLRLRFGVEGGELLSIGAGFGVDWAREFGAGHPGSGFLVHFTYLLLTRGRSYRPSVFTDDITDESPSITDDA